MIENSKKNPQLKKPDLEWQEQVIHDRQSGKCNHSFEFVTGSHVECKSCHFGLIGVYELKDGKPVV